MISNDGPAPHGSSRPSRSGVGLTNTKDRLRLHYQDSFTFQYTERPQGGVQIDISIPYKNTEKKKTYKAMSSLRLEGFEDAQIELTSEKTPAEQHIGNQLK